MESWSPRHFFSRPGPHGVFGANGADVVHLVHARQACNRRARPGKLGGGHMRLAYARLSIVAVFFLIGRTAAATAVTIGAGETYTLDADLVLHGADTLDANGTPQSPCTIVGNGHSIVVNGLTAHVKIQNCLLTGLGGPLQTSPPALDFSAQGTADLSITGSTFDACGNVSFHMSGSATATFNNNLLSANGIAYIEDELEGSMYIPAFFADGSGTGAKVFQGNRIYRSSAQFDGVTNWLVGGYGDQFTNVFVGHRGVIRVRGNHVKVVGNFVHPQYPLTSPDVENISVGSDDDAPDLIVEHNVLRSGEWVLRECQGEVRYNLIADMNGHAWIKGPHSCNLHHNIFVNYQTPDPNREAGVDVVYFTPHLNIYNNTFDGGGTIANLNVPAIHAGKGRLIERLSANAITSFIIPAEYAAVSSVDIETQYDTDPPPGDARMHYADYNLFYNPGSPSQTDYSVAVEPDDATPITKGSDGFAKHDVHAAPAFKGPLPTSFPYASADVQSGAVRVSDILAHYRDLYSPAAQSPLTGAGDPMFGAHQNIGAIGQGSDMDPSDQFGTFMPGPVGGPPPLPDAGVGTPKPDGGAPKPDGGGTHPDAPIGGSPPDGGVGGHPPDAPIDMSADAGTTAKATGGCSVGGSTTSRVSGIWAALLALAVAYRRRWPRCPSSSDASPRRWR